MRATPIVEHGLPSVGASAPDLDLVELSSDELDGALAQPATQAAPAAPLPATGHSRQQRPTSPTDVIARANASASQAPDAEGFVNAIMSYTFQPGGLYKIFAAPENVTDLVLEPGEEITGEPAAGDTLRWRLGVGSSAVNGVPQQHVFLKPTRAGLKTNLTINTSRRTYFLQLESVETDCMIAVQWNYLDAAPASEPSVALLSTPPPAGEGRADSTRPADVAALNFDYVVDIVRGKPAWRPRAIFDDGQKTFIRFDPRILNGESPALFVVERGELQLVNYRVKENLYVVDRLFDLAELRLGQDEQDILRIRRKSVPRSPTPRSAAPASPRKPGSPPVRN